MKCPDCNKRNRIVRRHDNYGADADGNRGMLITYWECTYCGYTTSDSSEFEDEDEEAED